MKNPLRKRLPRELRQEFGKYAVIFLLMVGTIGFVSGFLVADGSMITAYNESFEKYNIEDGNFRTQKMLNAAQQKKVRSYGISLYDNFYVEETLTNKSTLRIFQNREEINGVCLMKGSLPAAKDEIAIDRMYADNNNIRVGDVISSEKRTWKVTGLVALSDYSCLFSDNNDSMFDAVKFGVAVVTGESFADYGKEKLTYCYAWKYDTQPETEEEERDTANELVKKLASTTEMETFIPRYANQAIQFTGEDMGSDKAMMMALLYIVIVIMAFVFGVTINNTINKEANVIGTLRASGYTKGELLRHYMTTPIVVTVISAVLGNVLGYTCMKNVCANMYYGSYSLPTYVTIWNMEAFLMTTVVPIVIMLVVNFFLIRSRLALSPLKFLRGDLRKKRQRRIFPLPYGMPFFSRFRLRIIFQNMSNYVVLFVGIMFANLLLMFGLALPAVLDNYQEELEGNLLCEYQYILQAPISTMNDTYWLESILNMMIFQNAVETDNEDAEKFSAYKLQTIEPNFQMEEIMIYGVSKDSRYIPINAEGRDVYVSAAYADKYLLSVGAKITLKEPYGDEKYTFRVAGVYDYMGGLDIFMDQDSMNEVFDLGDGYFSGYLSDTEITDIDEQYISSVIDLEALSKISRQLKVSMGSMMYLVDGFSIIMFLILIYLLSKIIIEKNAQPISMAKILGYRNSEISRLYIVSTSVVVALSLLASLPLVYQCLKKIFRIMLTTSMTGWLPLKIESSIYVEMFVVGVVAYGVVAFLEYRRIKKVPMDESLKCIQ